MSDQPQEIPIIGDMQRLDVKPGDRFVLTVPTVLTMEQREHVASACKQFAEGVDPAPLLIILDGGAQLGVIRSAPHADALARQRHMRG